MKQPLYTLKPTLTPLDPKICIKKQKESVCCHTNKQDTFLRAENEDDDGYDPFSDRPAAPEPAFQEDPWR